MSLTLICGTGFAQSQSGTVNEDDIFSGESVVAPADTVTKKSVSAEIEGESLGFNGFLNSRNNYLMKRDWVLSDSDSFGNNTLTNYFQGNFSLDARQKQGIKGFANFAVDYYPTGTYEEHTSVDPVSNNETTTYEKVNATYRINEIFVDLNIKRLAYFRVGKQTLKWGQGYFWTPTDLINVEKKSFLDPYQAREGVYGVKTHIPFGTKANFYSFANLNDADNVNKPGLALKMEALFGNSEMSISAVFKKKSVSVYGYDITSRIFTVDVRGEASISYGESKPVLRLDMPASDYFDPNDPNKPPPTYERRHEWIPKACVGAGRSFDFLDVSDRIRIDGEFFYNHSGYDENVFGRSKEVPLCFVYNNIYEPNYYGVYYAAAFITISQIYVEELSAVLNYMMNISDRSSIVSGMMSYSMVYNMTIGLMVNLFLGAENREYTFMGNAASAELTVKLAF